MAAPTDEETNRWLWWASERGNESLEFKDQRVLGESILRLRRTGEVQLSGGVSAFRDRWIFYFERVEQWNVANIESTRRKVEIPNQHTSRLIVCVSWSRSER